MRRTIHDTWSSLPDNPDPEGVYVVIDVFKFTTTATELLQQGASGLEVFKDTNELVAFHDATGLPIGGEYRQLENEAVDLCNSPSYVAEHNQLYQNRDVGLRSDNGAKAVHAVPEEASLYLGSTVNASAVADAVATHDEGTVYLVCAGQHGKPAYEDLAAAHLIEHRLAGQSSLTLTRRLLKRVCETSQWQRNNGDKTKFHRADVRRALSIDDTTVVPTRESGHRFEQLSSVSGSS